MEKYLHPIHPPIFPCLLFPYPPFPILIYLSLLCYLATHFDPIHSFVGFAGINF